MAAAHHPRPAGILGLPKAVLFYVWIALVTLVMGIAWFFPVMLRPSLAHRLGVAWTGQILAAARVILGIRYEIRGEPPRHACIIAAKHQSFLDILIIAHAVPQCAFVMKRVLLYVPIMGFYARRVGSIPIDRSRGSDAMRQIAAGVQEAQLRPQGLGQLIIYPEGTRTRPGEKRKYKHGVASVRQATGLGVVPVAVNCGLFWPKKGYPFSPGTALVSFLPEIGPEIAQEAFMPLLYDRIEGESDQLLAEAGGLPQG